MIKKPDPELDLIELSQAFDIYIQATIDQEGNPKTPTHKDILKARAALPPYCKMAFIRSHEEPSEVRVSGVPYKVLKTSITENK